MLSSVEIKANDGNFYRVRLIDGESTLKEADIVVMRTIKIELTPTTSLSWVSKNSIVEKNIFVRISDFTIHNIRGSKGSIFVENYESPLRG